MCTFTLREPVTAAIFVHALVLQQKKRITCAIYCMLGVTASHLTSIAIAKLCFDVASVILMTYQFKDVSLTPLINGLLHVVKK